MTNSKGKELKIFLNGIEINGTGKFDFHTFASDEDAKKAVKEIEQMYADRHGEVPTIQPTGNTEQSGL
jgi:hypothetical protein